MDNRAGKYVNNLSGEAAYLSFRPTPLPPYPPINVDGEMNNLLSEVRKKAAILDGLAKMIPNVNLFVAMYVRKEALVSSQIEGTQCTLDDILNPQVEKNVNGDVADVINYIKATEYAIERLKTLPLCNRLIRETHAVLMEGVRGGDKTPGEFRRSQNWIGGKNSTIKNAKYIPPNVDDMISAMSDLEKYVNESGDADVFIMAALMHYQFETIHPFLDGNGRIGRLLITLLFKERQVLTNPVLYISCYLKSNRTEYYDRMTYVRTSGDYEQWIKFFLTAISATADDAIETIMKLAKLHETSIEKLGDITPSVKNKLIKTIEYLEKSPIIDVNKAAEQLGFSYNAAAKYVGILCEKQILRLSAKAGKARIYSYADYLDILRKDTE